MFEECFLTNISNLFWKFESVFLFIFSNILPTCFVYRHELLLFEALREGLDEDMETDPQFFVVGEDVDHYGGSYIVTKGMVEKIW